MSSTNVQRVPRGSNPINGDASNPPSKKRQNRTEGEREGEQKGGRGEKKKKKIIVNANVREREELKKKSIVKPNDGGGDNLKKTRTLFTIAKKQDIRRRIEADIEKYGSKKAKYEICQIHGIGKSQYYKWQKECIICTDQIHNYHTGGVKCVVKKCSAITCYPCLAKSFLMRVENIQRSEYRDISRAQCVLCRQENHVVCNSGPDGSDVNINCKVFGQCILNAIIKDINQCQQLLGKDCIELANFRKMLSGSSQQSLTKNEVNLFIKFKNFIKKYIGVTGESWAFNPAPKRVY